MSAFARNAIYAVPLCFTAGFLLSDHFEAAAEEGRLLTARVQQRLGEWTPPALTEEDRRQLQLERERCTRTIAMLQKRIGAAQQQQQQQQQQQEQR
jgi:hypothetical protein